MIKTREEALERIKKEIKAGMPIIGAGAGTGISAKFAEKGGVGHQPDKFPGPQGRQESPRVNHGGHGFSSDIQL